MKKLFCTFALFAVLALEAHAGGSINGRQVIPLPVPIAQGGNAVASLPVCILGTSGDQVIPTSTDTKLTFWSRVSSDASDPLNMYASGNVTVPIAGVYDVTAYCRMDDNTGHSTRLLIYLNGSPYKEWLAHAAYQLFIAGSTTMKLAANDVIAIYVWEDVGNQTFYGSSNRGHFSVRFRPAN